MERLTKRCGDTVLISDCIDSQYSADEVIDILAARLAAYEDTGLAPVQCKKLAEAEKGRRLVVLPEVPEKDRQAFIDGLNVYFSYASGGISGMTDGQARLTAALMQALNGRKEAGL